MNDVRVRHTIQQLYDGDRENITYEISETNYEISAYKYRLVREATWKPTKIFVAVGIDSWWASLQETKAFLSAVQIICDIAERLDKQYDTQE